MIEHILPYERISSSGSLSLIGPLGTDDVKSVSYNYIKRSYFIIS